MWKGTLALLTCMQLTGCATPFEKMWQGLATCELDTLHLDIETGRPANPQLAMYTPDKVSEGFAWYKVHQELHGLPIVDAALGSRAPLIGAAEYLLDTLKGRS